jgi:hypothetical protein
MHTAQAEDLAWSSKIFALPRDRISSTLVHTSQFYFVISRSRYGVERESITHAQVSFIIHGGKQDTLLPR